MRYRPFGNTDLTTSEIGFGCARIGGVFQQTSRAETLGLLRSALDRGVTFYDTADMYTQGESERLVGEAFHKQRDRVIIATKFGYTLPTQKRLVSRIKPLLRPIVSRFKLRPMLVHARVRGTVAHQDFSPAYIRQALEASLRRLQSDYIDVYQLHDPPTYVLEQGEFVHTLEQLRVEGKIRAWGVACQEPEHAVAALAHLAPDSIQVGLSVLEQAALDAALPGAATQGAAVIARQVLASGLVTRSVDSLQLDDIDYEPEVARRKRHQLATLASIAERCGRNRTEMALQFSLARPEVSVVLLGISRPDQLDSGLRALHSAPLSVEERELILSARRAGR